MKLIQVCFLSVFLIIGVSGCRGKTNIEDITLALILGIDVNDQGEIVMYMSSPVFSEDAKENNEILSVKSLGLKESRNFFDTMANGLTAGGKIQAVLIGSKVIEHKNWYSMMDMLYRDPKVRLNADLVFVNGPVADIFNFKPKDKPRLSIFIPQLIETADFRNVAYSTTLRNFYQMNFEKGITPLAPELSLVENVLKVSGTTLLNNDDLYVRTLTTQQTLMLKILKDGLKGQLSVTLPLNQYKKNVDVFTDDHVSFYVKEIKRKVIKKYSNGHYEFTINLKLPIMVTESPIILNDKTEKDLEKSIQKELQKQLNDLAKSLQKDKVDPVGFGIFAHSFKYSKWKKVEDDWIKSYEKAKIKVNVKIIIIDKGISE